MKASWSCLHACRKIQSTDEAFNFRRDLTDSSAQARSEGEMQGIDPGTFVLPQTWLPQCAQKTSPPISLMLEYYPHPGYCALA